MDLGNVASLITGGKPDKALSTMLAVWRKRRLPRLADAIDAVDRLVEKPWGPLFVDQKELRDRTSRVSTLGRQPPDPRFARALLDYLREMPFTSNGSRAMWSTVFVELSKIGDPRVIAAIADIRKGWKIRPLQRAWLDAQVEAMLEGRSKDRNGEPGPTADEARHLAAIERALATAIPVGGDARRDALVSEIYANPDDDAPRSVLADHLSADGDPRGLFITLQLVASPTAAQSKRIAALIAKHGRAWLGPLEPVIAKEDLVFTRGFMSGCRVKLKNEMEIERYRREPSWATVEHLRFTGTRFSYQPFSAQASGAFFVDPVMKSLRDVNLHDNDDLAVLLRYAWPRLERLATSTEVSLGKAGLALLASTTKLPALIAIEMVAPPKNWLARTKFGKRLRDVVLGLSAAADDRGLLSWIPELERLPALQTATIHASRDRDTYPRWTLARDAGGKLSIASVITIPTSYDHAIANLAALPIGQLSALRITLTARRGASITAAQRAAMTAAANRQTALAGFRA